MKSDDQKPEPKSAGFRMPPRPPIRVAVGLDSGGDEPDQPKRPKKDTVRIHLPPKPTAVPTIRLPGGGTAGTK